MTDNDLLRTRIESMRSQLARQIPAELGQALDDAATELGRRDFSAAVETGDPAPEFTLPDARGTEVSLSDLLAVGHVVVTFYRGSWCPYCNLQLAAYQEILDDLGAAGAQLVAISPELPDGSLSFVERQQLSFTVLSDVGNSVAKRYGVTVTLDGTVRETYETAGVDLPTINGDDSWGLPAPSTFVIDMDGIVRFALIGADYRRRLEPTALLEAVRAVASGRVSTSQ